MDNILKFDTLTVVQNTILAAILEKILERKFEHLKILKPFSKQITLNLFCYKPIQHGKSWRSLEARLGRFGLWSDCPQSQFSKSCWVDTGIPEN